MKPLLALSLLFLTSIAYAEESDQWWNCRNGHQSMDCRLIALKAQANDCKKHDIYDTGWRVATSPPQIDYRCRTCKLIFHSDEHKQPCGIDNAIGKKWQNIYWACMKKECGQYNEGNINEKTDSN